MKISVVLPAKDEARTVGATVQGILAVVPGAEVIVVNDGSVDQTVATAERAGAKVVHHPYSKGNGAAIKTGSRWGAAWPMAFTTGWPAT